MRDMKTIFPGYSPLHWLGQIVSGALAQSPLSISERPANHTKTELSYSGRAEGGGRGHGPPNKIFFVKYLLFFFLILVKFLSIL